MLRLYSVLFFFFMLMCRDSPEGSVAIKPIRRVCVLSVRARARRHMVRVHTHTSKYRMNNNNYYKILLLFRTYNTHYYYYNIFVTSGLSRGQAFTCGGLSAVMTGVSLP